MKAGFASVIALSLLVVTMPVLAQAQATTNPLTISINPQYPAPYDAVTITPSSDSIDLSSSQVSISVNGSVIQKGSGTTPVQIQAGGPGSTSKIVVTAVTNSGQTYTQEIDIHPADVALIMEPDSSTHPFYKGGSLVAADGTVRFVAIADLRTANGTPIPASSLVYDWQNGDTQLPDVSGIGKSVFTATAPDEFRNANIIVTVSSQDQSSVGQASILLTPVTPIVHIYQNDPLLGPLFNYALPDTVSMTDTEDTFRAVPYYFSGTPSLNWTVNGTQSQTGSDITVRSSGSGSGSAVIGFTAEQDATNQLANASMTVQFGVAKVLGIFGL